jgi:deoxycytidylate deaminase
MCIVEDTVPKKSTERQNLFLQKAAQLAFKSNMNQRHGCLIVNPQSDEIIATGYNHTYIKMCHKYSCHAECDALRKLKRNVDLANAEMYVVRIGPESLGHPLKFSKPCEGCATLIRKANVGRIFYSWTEYKE